MRQVKKMFVEFCFAGMIVCEREAREVKTRDITRLRVPKGAFSFKFYDVLTATVKVDEEVVTMTSEPFNESPEFYYGGRLFTLIELKQKFPNEEMLIGNVERNKYFRAIRTRYGSWMEFEESDILIPVCGRK